MCFRNQKAFQGQCHSGAFIEIMTTALDSLVNNCQFLSFFIYQVVIRPMMYVALTYDHRLVDGREAVMFLRKIKAAVEDPRIILAGL